tara:strand:+ start:339 stop:1181 length:843 start_codon:yes stop_codon:yes gene_type:complete
MSTVFYYFFKTKKHWLGMMKYIHQIWFDFNRGEPKDSMTERLVLRDAIMKHNSGFKYKIWSLEDALELTRSGFPEYFAFLDCDTNRNILKCDFFRYVLMYLYGGVYMDIDFLVLRPLDDFIVECGGNDIVLTRESHNSVEQNGTLHNGFLFSSKPGILFWKELCDSIIERYKSTDMLNVEEQDVYRFTGTKYLCTKWLQHRDSFKISVMPFHKVCNHWFVSETNRKFHSTNKADNEENIRDSTLSWTFLTIEDALAHSEELIKSGCHAICVVMRHGSYWK